MNVWPHSLEPVAAQYIMVEVSGRIVCSPYGGQESKRDR
jgi:hypothetical protein